MSSSPSHSVGRLRAAAFVLLLVPSLSAAQQVDSIRAGIARPVRTAPATSGTRESPTAAAGAQDSLRPPISPRRAFLYSLMLPGAGQAKLDRGYAGGMFFLIEVASLALVHRSAEDLRIARASAGDSVPLRYQFNVVTGLPVLDTNGNPTVAEWRVSPFDAAYVRTRRLHYEDWIAVLIFNHLFAGADAFVAAQLWDLPGKVAIRQTPFGPLVQASFRFR